jgi:ABC-type Fe3+ transport system permease subunit
MKLRHLSPLIGFVVPTVVIGYGVVIPGSCIASVNPLSIGFGTTVLGACMAYVVGVRAILREVRACGQPPGSGCRECAAHMDADRSNSESASRNA